mmetsp:Transcript_23845/g.54238  ORF Transcript_23845/g.54238 Transcript_23845/m.54238 type:complete len:1202 (+) Transcript_23845:25-3630(+)
MVKKELPGQLRSFSIREAEAYVSNEVRTSKYTLWNFLPKNLFEQFQRMANIYFVFLCILQVIPAVSNTAGTPTVAIPLTFVVVCTAIKDAVEDSRRRKSDRLENKQLVNFVPLDGAGTKLPSKVWRDVRVGEIICVRNREFIPADCILLGSSDTHGVAYIETANLDGETNLKLKRAHGVTAKWIGTEGNPDAGDLAAAAAKLTGRVECEAPNPSLYTFEGTMNVKFHSDKPLQADLSLTSTHMLLRGCKLRNTAWALACVVFTGHESKIQMNSSQAPHKQSALEKLANKLMLIILAIQVVLCLGGAVAGAIYQGGDAVGEKYLGVEESSAAELLLYGVTKFFTFLIIFGNFIPISLIVTLGVVKLLQGFFIGADEDMSCGGTKAAVRTSDLNEELGQIEYIFSDKTGTLTRNRMEFRKCSIWGNSYGMGIAEVRRRVLKKMGLPIPADPVPPPGAKKTPHVNLVDSQLETVLADEDTEEYRHCLRFFLHLAINHTVMCEASNIPDIPVAYSASSPDEGALVYAASHFGFTFSSRDSTGLYVNVRGREIKVIVEADFEFTSARKCSSIACRIQWPEGPEEFVVFCKGADSAIMRRLTKECGASATTATTIAHMEEYARDGLRVLCIGGRYLSYAEYQGYIEKFQAASMAMDDRQGKLDAVAALLEQELELWGATAVEDQLQEDVGDTIASLQEAGIKIWMLTGDKVETATNIGVATSLLNNAMHRTVLTADENQQAHEVDAAVKKACQDASANAPNRELALIVDGFCLQSALKPDNIHAFMALALRCTAVICCRVSPEQKGAVVRGVRDIEKAITLAIGDGANDCNMIQSADVGVGLRGEEGMQAFNCSDYGLSQFKFLKTLLLVHGRWAYRRNAKLVLFMFYKNVVVVLPQFYLNAVSLFSGQRLYIDLMYQLYNVAFTSFPIIVLGVLDQDCSKNDSLRHPQLYKLGPQRFYFNKEVFVQWVISGMWHSLVVFCVPYLAFSGTQIPHSDGRLTDLWTDGMIVYLCVVIVANAKCAIENMYHTWVLWAILAISVLAWPVCLMIFEGNPALESFGTYEMTSMAARLFSTPIFHIVVLLTAVVALSREFLWKSFRRTHFPTPYHEIQDRFNRSLGPNPPTEVQPRQPVEHHDNSGYPKSDGSRRPSLTTYTEGDKAFDHFATRAIGSDTTPRAHPVLPGATDEPLAQPAVVVSAGSRKSLTHT